MNVILIALKAVPRAYNKVYVETTEITALELEQLENERWAATKATGGLPCRRISPGLFDMVDPSNIEHRGITYKDGKTYHWWYWSKDPINDQEVSIEMERNLLTGELTPWIE